MKPYVSRLSGNYQNYQAALDACPTALFKNNDATTGFETIRARREAFLSDPDAPFNARAASKLLPYLAANGLTRNKPRILDVGGAEGLQYFWQRRFYGEGFCERYDILEAPEVVKHAKELPVLDCVRYFDDIEALRGERYTCVAFSAMLQIMEKPAEFFEQVLSAVSAETILVTVFPFVETHFGDRVSVKRISVNTDAKAHPYWTFGKNWKKLFRSHGSISLSFPMPSHAFYFAGEQRQQWAFIIRR